MAPAHMTASQRRAAVRKYGTAPRNLDHVNPKVRKGGTRPGGAFYTAEDYRQEDAAPGSVYGRPLDTKWTLVRPLDRELDLDRSEDPVTVTDEEASENAKQGSSHNKMAKKPVEAMISALDLLTDANTRFNNCLLYTSPSPRD